MSEQQGQELSSDDEKALRLVYEKSRAMAGARLAAKVLERELDETVRKQRHVVPAPEGSEFVIERAAQLKGAGHPPVRMGLYTHNRDNTGLAWEFPRDDIPSEDSGPFIATRLEASMVGYMAVNDEEYRLIDFEIDHVKVQPQTAE
jgi:hypothetical protein